MIVLCIAINDSDVTLEDAKTHLAKMEATYAKLPGVDAMWVVRGSEARTMRRDVRSSPQEVTRLP